MKNDIGRLGQVVTDRLEESGNASFSPEALEALRLCDLFDNVKPDDYLLPIDAMAGFVVARQQPDAAVTRKAAVSI
jgi:hypothetical protein